MQANNVKILIFCVWQHQREASVQGEWDPKGTPATAAAARSHHSRTHMPPQLSGPPPHQAARPVSIRPLPVIHPPHALLSKSSRHRGTERRIQSYLFGHISDAVGEDLVHHWGAYMLVIAWLILPVHVATLLC